MTQSLGLTRALKVGGCHPATVKVVLGSRLNGWCIVDIDKRKRRDDQAMRLKLIIAIMSGAMLMVARTWGGPNPAQLLSQYSTRYLTIGSMQNGKYYDIWLSRILSQLGAEVISNGSQDQVQLPVRLVEGSSYPGITVLVWSVRSVWTRRQNPPAWRCLELA
jgi:hypothetical protein